MSGVEQLSGDGERDAVQVRYGSAAATLIPLAQSGASCGEGACCGAPDGCGPVALEDSPVFGAGLYADSETVGLPEAAVLASLGCGNPTAVAELRTGETVLDLGSGGGIDVLLSARRVGPTGTVYGVDLTDQMLELARANAAAAGASNVEFRKGGIEALPIDDESIDVVISNCVINLSDDKPAVAREVFRVLKPGGRLGVSDVVAEDHLSPAERRERGANVGCVAGALSESEYHCVLHDAGLIDVTLERTHEVVPGMHGAIVRARKP